MSIGPIKLAYLVTHGWAPYFHDELLQVIHEFFICFDEDFNKMPKKGQMDLVIRFWPRSVNQVTYWYLSSYFKGHSAAKDIMNSSLYASDRIKLSNSLQISMDGEYVINLYVKQIKLTDWVSLIIDRNSAVLSDSFGTEYIPQVVLNKIKGKSITLNIFRIQSDDSTSVGFIL